ncbi:MAG: hypothetical protein IKV03_04375 [Alphaproteobacteria bacterium]|nr:hypothetical protein [Alphaproteobacteria bacterium]
MTQETQTAKNSLLEAFLKQRAKRQNSAAVEAKRLVNLYRQLSLFGDEFLEKYNVMLLEASPEVQMVLPDIVGGTVVRQYLEFLKGRAKQSDADSIISEEDAVDAYQYRHAESYLPTPDEVPPFSMEVNVGGGVSNGIDTATLSAQLNAFERALEQQNAFLVQALAQFKQEAVLRSELSNSSQSSDFTQMQKDVLSELLTRQNEQMNANINTILSQTQEISARQMEAVEKLMQKQPVIDPYAVIEEDVPVVSDTSKKVQKFSYGTRYRSEEPAILHQTEVELEPINENLEDKSQETSTEMPKRYSSISLNEYYSEEDDVLEGKETSDWKG